MIGGNRLRIGRPAQGPHGVGVACKGRTCLMGYRLTLAAAALCAAVIASPARAQIANLPPALDPDAGWTFAVTPYGWMPTLSTTYKYNTPRGNTVTNTVSAGIGDYISHINFATMIGAEARYDRFTAMTDFVYLNASFKTANSHFSTLNVGPGPIYIPREQQLFTGTRNSTGIWSVAGGYTLLRGDWGNLDAVAGLRMLFSNNTTNYTLTADVLLPDRTIGLARTGSLTLGTTKVEGVGGVTGRLNIPNSSFFVPFYFDAGGGSVPLTWQAYSAIAWQATDYLDVSAGYRYMAFSGGKKTGFQNVDLGGAIIAANFHF
jgi:hypothetical protein